MAERVVVAVAVLLLSGAGVAGAADEARGATSDEGTAVRVLSRSIRATWDAPRGWLPAHVTAQSPTFGVGRPPTAEELKAIDIEIMPDGRGLPPGSGTATAGQAVYVSRCATCHGPSGKEGPQDILVGGQGTLKAPSRPLKTVGSYWPYATTLWDYIRRAMPFDHPGTLTSDEVYATTAYLLYMNGIVDEHEVVNQTSLPAIKMPNRGKFVPDPRPDVGRKKQ